VKNGTSAGSVNPLPVVMSDSWVLEAVFVDISLFAGGFESGARALLSKTC